MPITAKADFAERRVSLKVLVTLCYKRSIKISHMSWLIINTHFVTYLAIFINREEGSLQYLIYVVLCCKTSYEQMIKRK
jgi:hypothetical protein